MGKPMNQDEEKRLRELCAAAADESDSERLMVLVQQIIELTDRAQVPGQKPLPAA